MKFSTLSLLALLSFGAFAQQEEETVLEGYHYLSAVQVPLKKEDIKKTIEYVASQEAEKEPAIYKGRRTDRTYARIGNSFSNFYVYTAQDEGSVEGIEFLLSEVSLVDMKGLDPNDLVASSSNNRFFNYPADSITHGDAHDEEGCGGYIYVSGEAMLSVRFDVVGNKEKKALMACVDKVFASFVEQNKRFKDRLVFSITGVSDNEAVLDSLNRNVFYTDVSKGIVLPEKKSSNEK